MVACGWWSSVQRERRVVALQRAQDLAADVLVGVAVVPDVEVRELALGHALLVGQALAHAVQQRLACRSPP